jgi:hypothetical protein
MHDNHKKATFFSLKAQIIITAISLALVSFLLYAPTLHFGFINFDDHTVLLDHPELYDETSFVNSLRQIFFTAFPREEPLLLRDISWAMDSRLFGFTNPFGYHLGNVFLNSLNCALVFLLLWKTHRRFYAAFWMAVLYAVLPVHGEPVCWIMGRKDMLVSFFMLTALILQTIELSTSSEQVRLRCYLLGILATLAALLSKINALSFFIVLLLHRFFFPYLNGYMTPSQPFDKGINRRFLKAGMSVMPHAVISIFIFFWYKGILSQWGVLDRGVDSLSLYHVKNLVFFTPLIIGRYLQLVFLPGDFQIFYDWPSIHQPLTVWNVGLSIGLGILILLALLYTWRRHRDICFYLTAFLALMVPYFNIMYIGIWMANRYIYFSSLCLLTAAFLSLERSVLKNRPGRHLAASVVLAVVVAIWAGHTWYYQKVFKDDASLWRYETGLRNPTLMAYASMAAVDINLAGDEPGAKRRMPFYDKAAAQISAGFNRFHTSNMKKSAPHLFQLYYVQGVLAGRRGMAYGEQLNYFEKAYELKPLEKSVLWKMAETLFRLAATASDTNERRHLATRSMDMLEDYIHMQSNTEDRMARIVQLLEEEYRPRFPFLQSRINKIRLLELANAREKP